MAPMLVGMAAWFETTDCEMHIPLFMIEQMTGLLKLLEDLQDPFFQIPHFPPKRKLE